jgi:hypothetical protein
MARLRSQRLLTRASTAAQLSLRAINAEPAGPVGIRKLNMSHTPNTKNLINEIHEAWARENGYREEAASPKRQAPSTHTIKPQALRVQKSQAN